MSDSFEPHSLVHLSRLLMSHEMLWSREKGALVRESLVLHS